MNLSRPVVARAVIALSTLLATAACVDGHWRGAPMTPPGPTPTDEPCPVTVLVTTTLTGCKAVVDKPQVHVQGAGVCQWNLVADPANPSTDVYTFVEPGIAWTADPRVLGDTDTAARTRGSRHFARPSTSPPIPPPDAADPQPATVLQRQGRGTGSESNYYKPVVKRLDGVFCEAPDPRIAND